MLEFLTGRARSGKSAEIIGRICENARRGISGQILMVPEQYSHDTERRLLAAAGNGISLYAEVLTFRRLTNRVFSLEGGLARQYLDDGGRILVMNRALDMVRDELVMFKQPSKRKEFLKNLLDAAGEFKSCLVTPGQLKNASDILTGGLAQKLADLSLICETYEALTERISADPAGMLDTLADKLKNSDYLRDKRVYIDGFSDFTLQELEIVKIIAEKAPDTTIALTYDEDEGFDESGIFEPQRRTLEQLTRYAERERVSLMMREASGEYGIKPELKHLERALFDYSNPVFEEECPAISVFSAETMLSECAVAASEILCLVREYGYRYGEIAVAVRDFGRYADTLETVFERYGIPIFADDLSDITKKPVLSLITAALDAVSGGFEYDAVFRYIKSGLLNIEPDDCHMLENYVLKWSLRGSAWTRERPWSENPRGYVPEFTEDDRESLERINTARAIVRAPLMELRDRALKDKTALGQIRALYSFIEEIGLPETLEKKTSDFTRRGELKLAAEYAQLWDILTDAIDQCAAVLGDTDMELGDFAALFKLILSAGKVATIPVSLDRVSAGEAMRLGQRDVKCLFVLGANDGSFPPPPEPAGVFSDDERTELKRLGIQMEPVSSERLGRELGVIYRAFSLPSDRLYVSYTESGSGDRPSFAVTRLSVLFPKLKVTTERALGGAYKLSTYASCMELAAVLGKTDGEAEAARLAYECISQKREYNSALRRALSLRYLPRGPLSRPSVGRLFGKNVRMSASRIDAINSCRFSYFMRYGLKAETREPAGFFAPETGTFIHYVLEHVTRNVKELGGFGKVSGEQLNEITGECVRRYADEVLRGLDDKPARFVYLFRRLVSSVYRLVLNLADELAESDFEPVEFELKFAEGGKLPPVSRDFGDTVLTVGGFVDRVDAWEKDGKLYMRVLDYKTGGKKFSLSDIWHGLGMQMLIYLFALEEHGAPVYGHEVIPAGALYMTAAEAVVQAPRSMPDAEIKKLLGRKLSRSGIVLEDAEVIAAMEHGIESEAKYLPVKKNKDGSFAASSSVATLERLGKLQGHVEGVLKDIAREIKAGNIEANPYCRTADDTACTYCEFKSACQFDTKNGRDRLRYLYHIGDGEFWRLVEGGGADTGEEGHA